MKKEVSDKYQIIIIGGGVGGISTALWCQELGLKSILLESSAELGGQLLWTYNAINNYLGIKANNGRELQKIFLQQIQPLNLEIKTNSEICAIDVVNKEVTLKNGQTLRADFLVIATGIYRRKLNLADEEKFKGKGILESGKRDAEKVRGKKVCIVGGGDAALENALILAEFAEKVTLIHRRKDFRARLEFVEKVKNYQKVEILSETVVTQLIGEQNLETLEVENLLTKEKRRIATDFLLLRLGVEPNTKLLLNQINLDANGYCQIDANCETNMENIYAIGDVANPIAPTISGAVGMGATVAKNIASKLIG